MLVAVILGACYFLVITNVIMIIPTLPFIAQDFHLNGFLIGAILAAFPVVALPANLILGPISDRVGRKRLLCGGAALCSLIYFLSAQCSSGLELLLLRLATGIALSMIGCSIFSSIPDYFAPASRLKITGYVSSAGSWAQLIAVPSSAFIAETLGWRVSFLMLAGFAVGLAGLVLALPAPGYMDDPSSDTHIEVGVQHAGMVTSLKSRRIVGLLSGYAFYSCGMFTFMGLYPAWLLQNALAAHDGHGISMVFLAGGVGGLVGALSSGHVGALFRPTGRACAILTALTTISLVWVPLIGASLMANAFCFFLASVLRSILLPNLISGTMSLVLPSRRGKMNGLLAAVFQGGTALGGALSAWVYGLDPFYIANAIVSLIFFLIATVAFENSFRTAGATKTISRVSFLRRTKEESL